MGNSVFIPLGLTGPDYGKKDTSDHTSYNTLRIPQIGFYAYRTHSDMQWQFINVSALNFGGDRNTTNFMKVDKFGFNDITADFATSSGNERCLRLHRMFEQLEPKLLYRSILGSGVVACKAQRKVQQSWHFIWIWPYCSRRS